MKIIVADDHELIASGIRSFLMKKNDNIYVDSALNVQQLNQLLLSHSYTVLLQDIRFGDTDARTFIKDIKYKFPNLRLIALSSHVDAFTVKSSLASGFDAYVSKSSPVDEIYLAIEAVLINKQYVSSDIEQGMLSSFLTENKQLKLTNRELEVLKGIHDELSTKEIAAKLFLSEKTIEGYRSSLFLKFDVKNVAGLVKQAILHGFV